MKIILITKYPSYLFFLNLGSLRYITDYICEGVDLTGVEIVEQDRRFVKQARKEVETQAQKMLEQGMETQVNHYQ